MKRQNKNIQNQLMSITQLGISCITPLLLCLFVSLWIQNKWDTGFWVVVAGIVIGVGGMATTFYRFIKKHSNEKQQTEEKYQFNDHL